MHCASRVDDCLNTSPRRLNANARQYAEGVVEYDHDLDQGHMVGVLYVDCAVFRRSSCATCPNE